MNQPTLFEARPKHRTQETSRDALRSLVALDTRRALVYQAIVAHGPVTDKELVGILGWPINTVTPRRNELVRAGVIVSTGQRRGGGTLWRVK